ncbi:retinoic acid receptor responder protein 2-like isoform X2 [Xenopus laevis]|uniref:Retinoic acid receptor responder protein 2-like isoform X2 n=1 Tax=Xenopus laevis TaxID=8355 RepID=A0A8J1KWG5_XENLA|nr:retinoic acid receptor responder protein 2-like isoform X2 [Xenopus laevis]
MKISRTWSLLVALGFIVAVSGQIPVSELSDLQKKAMSLVTEHFYEKYNPTYNFTTTVLEASQEDLFRGIFVRLHIEKQQSNCRRNDPTAVKCRPRRKKGLTSDWEIQCRRVNEKAPEQLPGGYSVMLRSSSELRRPSGTKEQRNLEAQ